MPEVKLNDVVKVYVEEQENIEGQLNIIEERQTYGCLEIIFKRHLTTIPVVPGFVKRRTKGGLIVDIYSIETFLSAIPR